MSDDRQLGQLQQAAETAAEDYTAHRAAVGRKCAVDVALLHAAIEIVRPALPAICSPVACEAGAISGLVISAKWKPHPIYLRDDGTLVTMSGTVWEALTEERFACEQRVRLTIQRLLEACQAQRRHEATAKLDAASDKIEAILTLLG